MAGPLLCDPAQKADLEARNGVEQIDHLSDLVIVQKITEVREGYVRAFHSLAVHDIYPCAGQYRTAGMNVQIQGSKHQIPEAALVPGLVMNMIDKLNGDRETASAIERAAYALWRVNWIHPFAGGNGRTARALSYLVICLDLQTMPPGLPQMPTLIFSRRNEYKAALEAGDHGELTKGAPDLGPMCALIEDVVMQQAASAVDRLANRPNA